jgi:hypothetical protein
MALPKKPITLITSVHPRPEFVSRCESTHDDSRWHDPKHKRARIFVWENSASSSLKSPFQP